MIRCAWAAKGGPEEIQYHDTEWGCPSYDDHYLFESLILDGAQAGLSWVTILKKRDGYRKAFDHFDAEKMAQYGDRKKTQLLNNPSIVRNRLKIESAINNAKCFLEVKESFGSFSDYIWQFVGGTPTVNAWSSSEQVPVSTPESDAMAKNLKKRGFKFVGTTICYAYMQAVGMVNDHTTNCFRYPQLL